MSQPVFIPQDGKPWPLSPGASVNPATFVKTDGAFDLIHAATGQYRIGAVIPENLYLADALSTAEYAAKKEKLVLEKATISEKITDIEQQGVSWLEPAREFVLSLNQAANLLSRNEKSEMTAFLKTIGSNHVLRNREFVFDPKMQYARAAAPCAAASSDLQFPNWCAG